MKLGIVIPLKSKQISKNWDITSKALEGTLNSILQQSFGQYRVAVCGHNKPDFMNTDKYASIDFVVVDFPVPDRRDPNFSHQQLILDKNLKIATALAHLKDQDIDYWYPLDSDDLLHKDFIKNLQAMDGMAGAIIEGGYILYSGQNRAIQTDEMSQYCGSTSVLAKQYVTLPENIDADSIKQLPWARYPHMAMAQFFSKEINCPYLTIDQLMLGYVLATGDNISDKWRDSPIKVLKAMLKPYLKGREISPAMKIDFALDNE